MNFAPEFRGLARSHPRTWHPVRFPIRVHPRKSAVPGFEDAIISTALRQRFDSNPFTKSLPAAMLVVRGILRPSQVRAGPKPDPQEKWVESIWKIAGQRNAAVGAIRRRPAALSVRRNLSEWRRFPANRLSHSQFVLTRVNSRLNAFGCG